MNPLHNVAVQGHRGFEGKPIASVAGKVNPVSVRVMAEVFANGPRKPADRLMLLAIADNCDDNGVAWPGVATLAAKCAVGVKAARSTIKRLEVDGWVSVVRGGGTIDGIHGRPNRYQIKLDRLRATPPPTSTYPPVGVRPTLPPTGGEPSVEPSVEPKNPDADAFGGPNDPIFAAAFPPPGSNGSSLNESAQQPRREEHPMPRHQPSTPADTPLTGMPEPEPGAPPLPSAGLLVAAWVDGWSQAHNGAQPHPSVVKRVAGVARNVAKECTNVDQWRDAWRASLAAGRQGRYDVVAHLAAPVQQTRGNHYLSIARDTMPASTALAAALGPRAIEAS